MKFTDRLKKLFEADKDKPTEEEITREKKESIDNLTQGNEFLNDSVNKLFDILND